MKWQELLALSHPLDIEGVTTTGCPLSCIESGLSIVADQEEDDAMDMKSKEGASQDISPSQKCSLLRRTQNVWAWFPSGFIFNYEIDERVTRLDSLKNVFPLNIQWHILKPKKIRMKSSGLVRQRQCYCR